MNEHIFDSRAYAAEVAWILQHMTGDECAVVMVVKSGGKQWWIVDRYDASGKTTQA